MKTIAISGSPRANVGKRDAKELRYEGNVPCVLYGGDSQVHFSASASDLRTVLYTPEALFVELTVDGKKSKSIVQEAQFHPVTDQILHVDFLLLDDHKPVSIQVPVKLTGTSPGVKVGGKLIQKFRKLKVKGFPNDFTDSIEVSIDGLELGKSIRVGDLKLNKLEILNSKADTIVSVASSRATKEAEAAAGK
jgi:large subunit ribosomal protein L25